MNRHQRQQEGSNALTLGFVFQKARFKKNNYSIEKVVTEIYRFEEERENAGREDD